MGTGRTWESNAAMGISRDSFHKRRATGGKLTKWRKKRKFELGRQAADTKIGVKRIRTVRTRGGNTKYRALRIDTGNYSWATESVTRKVRVLNVVYNSTNNELVRTNTLVTRKLNKRQQTRVLAKELEQQFNKGRLLACVSSRPGQSGRCDGYILEGAELKFYAQKMSKKGSK